MARIKKYSPLQNLSSFQTFINDDNPNSDYFRITEFKDTFTGGKNGFLIEGSEYLKESTEIKIELLDVNGDPIYFEPGNGIPEYYEGISKLIAVYIYNDTPIGLGKITVLGELKEYDDEGVKRVVPDQWEGVYNVKWERTFQVNKNISNEDRVRFYRRPEVTIDEINKPIFSNNSRLVTQTGTVDGIPLVPIENTNLSNFSLPTSYRLKIKTGDNWTGSIEGDPINFDNINYNPIVEEVVNETELIVTPPYSENGLVKSLTNENYSVTFPYLEGINDLATALTGSFAKIKITDMKTFVGDAARVKIFRRSQSNITDFEFVQEIQLESNELLRDIETFSAPEELYGFFTEPIIEEYWVTSSNDLSVSFNQNFLYNSTRLNSIGDNLFFTTKSLDIENDIEYSLDFNTRLSGSLTIGEKLTVFLSGSLNNVAKSQTIIEIPSSNGVFQKTNFNENFIADEFDSAQLYFGVNGSNWYINNLSLKASQETSFSPDVITFIQNVPKTLAVETFDYRFEFYDINNNYIPVLVEATKRFDGGNLNLFDKELEITPSNLYFTFDSASLPANPMPPTSIIFDIETSLLTGSISFTSGAYDEFGNFLSASEYAGGQYPGLLKNIDTRTPVLNVADFTGSRSDIVVQYIRFTGFAEGISDEVVITRVQDGKGGVNFEITPFRGTSIKNNSDKDLEIQAYRIDGINRIELKDGLPQTGFSDAKLRVLSSSIDPITTDVSSSYFLLSEAQTSGFIRGLTAGTTGSGEIDYNATFNRDSIDKELTVYLMDGPTSESILTSIILNDLQDGLASGFISFDAEQFGINPRDERVFTPEIGRVTGSFYLRGTNSSPISGTLDIYPSMSVDPETKEPFYYMFYATDSFDRRIDIVVTDKDNNIVDSGRPGEDGVPYFVPIERKQLTTTFTYTEDITSASISVDKTFFSVPDGLPGADSIIVDIDPRPVVLNADQRGNVFNYSNADTTITVTQGRLPLIFDDTKKPGTFTTSSITPLGIEYTTFDEILGDATMSLSGFQKMMDLTASVTYDLEIHPYFTGSFYTQSFVQQFKKTLEGADAINIELDPVSVTIDAEENGGIFDFSSANTTLRVKQGDTYMEFSTSSLVLPGTFSASLSPNQISVGTFSSSNDNSTERNLDDTLHFRDFNNFLTDSGSVDYEIKIYPFSITSGILSGSQTVNRKQLFSKNKEGIRARSVELSTTTEVANYDKDGIITSPVDASSLEPTSIFLTATPFNITSSQAYYQFFQEGFAVTFPGTNNQFEVGSGDLPAPGTTTTYRVDLRDGSTSGPVFASKEVTISGVQSGANNYQVFLTNPSPTITVKVDGELDLSTTGTQIKAFKGTQELTNVQNYSSQQLDNVGDPIGTLGEYSSSIFNLDTYITQPSFPQGNPASVGPLTDWTLPQDNPTATVIYKVDIENGRATYFLSQSIASTKEGDVGPGLVFRGPWTGSIEYIYNKESKRRDSVLYSESGNEPYDTYYATKDSGSSFITPNDSSPGAGDAQAPTRADGGGGREVNTDYWVSLGQEEFFVAAKLAIFEESFVKNTLNVGTPPTSYAVNPQITIAGGTDEPYIAVGQTGTIGFQEQGIWLGMSNSAGDAGTSILPKMSMKSNTTGGKYKALEWNGETLTLRGALRQTPEGEVEGRILATWNTLVDTFSFVPGDTTSHNGITWECILAHDKGTTPTYPKEPGTGGSYTTYWQESNLAAKTLRLSSTGQSFVEARDGTLSPDFIEFTASKENIGTATSWTTSPSVTLYDASTGGSSTTTGDTVYLRKADFGTNTSVTVTATAGGKSDEITVVRLIDGSDGITVVNTNQSHTLPSNGDGVVSSYSNSGTIISVYEGTTKLEYDGTGTSNGSWSLSTSQVPTSTLTIGGNDGIDISGKDALVNDHSAMANGTSTVIIGYDISGKRVNGSGFTTETTQTITKASSAKTLRLSADTLTFTKAKNGSVSPNFITLVSNRQNTDSTTTWTTSPAVDLYTDATTGTTTVNGDDTVFLRKADFGSNTAVKVTATAGTLSDDVTIVGIEEGSDAIAVILSNESHTLQTTAAGVVDYGGSGTTISVYEGAELLDYVPSGTGNGEWDVSTSPSNISVGTISQTGTAGDRIASVGQHNTMNANQASITYTISGKKLNGVAFSFTKIQSFSKSIQGESGTSGTAGSGGVNGQPGQPGTPGAGVVFRGLFDLTKSYFHTAERRDIVEDSNGDYWITDNLAFNGDPGSDWSDPASDDTDWEAFGAQFSSVATDILFATDVYADQTINVGASGSTPVIALNADAGNSNANPFIAIGQTTQGFTSGGIYLGYDNDEPVFSMTDDSSRFFVYEEGSIRLSDASFGGVNSSIIGSEIKVGRNLSVAESASNAYNFTVSTDGIVSASEAFIQGTIQGNDGRIGDWFINPLEQDGGGNQIGGQLRDSDSEIVLDPNIPEIQMFKDDTKKLFIGVTGLSDIAAIEETFTFASTQPVIPESSLLSPNDASSYSDNSNVGFEVSVGSYNFQQINHRQLIVEPPSNFSGTNSVDYPTYAASYSGQFHGSGPNFGTSNRSISAYLYLEVVDANNGDAVIGTKYMGGAGAASGHPELQTYVAGGFGGQLSVVGTTKITLSDGTTKLAKDITITDKILAWDDNTKKFKEAILSKIHKRNVSQIYKVTAGGKEVEVSDSHGFWKFGNEINSGEIKAKSLYEEYKKGTLNDNWKIYIKDNHSIKLVDVDKVEIIEKEEEVITLTVPKYVNYISNDIISHNAAQPGGGGTNWVLSTIQYAFTATGNGTLAPKAPPGEDEVITISTATTNARIRWRLSVYTSSGKTCAIAANGTVTSTNHTFTAQIGQQSGGNDVYFNSTRIIDPNGDGTNNPLDIKLEKSNNFVEIQPGGLQVVTTDSQFIRMRRKDSATISTAADAELFRVQGGTSYFTGVASPFETAISVDGHIRPFNDTGNGPWELGGPYTTSTTNNFSKLNGMDISGMTVSLAGGPVTSTGTTYQNTSTGNYDSYVTLPGGVILQFGYTYNTNPTSRRREIVFGTAFPNALLSAGCSTLRSDKGGDGYNHVYNMSKSRMWIIIDGDRGFWWAMGK